MEISDWLYGYLSIDLPPVLTALAVAISCALLGNILLLRRMSLLGDAMSHAVLPGIVVAFLVSTSRNPLPIFIGAAIAALLTSVLIDTVHRFGKVEHGASMGVVFSIFFAVGIVLIEQAAARSVDLDADCLLHGQLETLFWYPPHSLQQLFSFETLSALPMPTLTSIGVLVVVAVLLKIFWKEIQLISFDEALANSLGFRPALVSVIILALVAAAVVASFEAVGSILVIAMLIVPGATARYFTDRYSDQFKWSVIIAVVAVVTGYFAAATLPAVLGLNGGLNAAGSIVTTLAVFLLLAAIFGSPYGAVARFRRKRRMNVSMAREDVLGILFRLHEEKGKTWVEQDVLFKALESCHPTHIGRNGLRLALRRGLVMQTTNGISLTPMGRRSARTLVRRHRLWESYLVHELGLRPDHVHDTAEQLEHFTSDAMASHLAAEHFPGEQSADEQTPRTDPHGKVIPDES